MPRSFGPLGPLVLFLVLAAAMPGCLEDERPPGVVPETESEPAPEPPGRQGADGKGGIWYSVEETLVDGTGVFLHWAFPGPSSEMRANFDLTVSCGRVLFLSPSVMEVEEGERHFAFTPDVRLTTSGIGGGSFGSSSSPVFVGVAAAVVADGEACVSLNVTVEGENGKKLTVQPFASTWSTHGPYTVDDGRFDMPIGHAGWTHAHRMPGCETPAEPVAPSELLTASLTFPNEIRQRAGLYMNGIFPGPTIDDARFFGVWHDEPGDLQVDIAAPLPECLVVVDTDLVPAWNETAIGYVDRWWRQEPFLPPRAERQGSQLAVTSSPAILLSGPLPGRA